MRRLPLIFVGAAFALSLVADAVIAGGGEGHAEFWWSHFYGFFSLYGFVGCMATIWFAKILGTIWLSRGEHYYDSKYRHE